jgi:iron complex outermembrane recepter protein
VRIVDTHTTSSGFDQAVQSIVLQNANDDFYTITLAPASPRQVKNDYVEVLPSANFKYDLNTSMDVRAAF